MPLLDLVNQTGWPEERKLSALLVFLSVREHLNLDFPSFVRKLGNAAGGGISTLFEATRRFNLNTTQQIGLICTYLDVLETGETLTLAEFFDDLLAVVVPAGAAAVTPKSEEPPFATAPVVPAPPVPVPVPVPVPAPAPAPAPAHTAYQGYGYGTPASSVAPVRDEQAAVATIPIQTPVGALWVPGSRCAIKLGNQSLPGFVVQQTGQHVSVLLDSGEWYEQLPVHQITTTNEPVVFNAELDNYELAQIMAAMEKDHGPVTDLVIVKAIKDFAVVDPLTGLTSIAVLDILDSPANRNLCFYLGAPGSPYAQNYPHVPGVPFRMPKQMSFDVNGITFVLHLEFDDSVKAPPAVVEKPAPITHVCGLDDGMPPHPAKSAEEAIEQATPPVVRRGRGRPRVKPEPNYAPDVKRPRGRPPGSDAKRNKPAE